MSAARVSRGATLIRISVVTRVTSPRNVPFQTAMPWLAQQPGRFEQRQAHHTGVAAGDFLDEHRTQTLDGVSAGLALRLARRPVGVYLRGGKSRGIRTVVCANPSDGIASLTTQSPVNTSCLRSREQAQHAMQSVSSAGFSRMPPSTCTVVSAASTGRSRCRATHRHRLFPGEPGEASSDGVSSAPRGFIDIGRCHHVRHADELQQLAAARRCGCEAQHRLLFFLLFPIWPSTGREFIRDGRGDSATPSARDTAVRRGSPAPWRAGRSAPTVTSAAWPSAGLAAQAVRTADDEGEIAAVLLALAQPFGKLQGG